MTPAETKISVLLSASVKRFFVSRMRDFLSKKRINENVKNLLQILRTKQELLVNFSDFKPFKSEFSK